MKKNNLITIFFSLFIIAIISFGIYYILNNIKKDEYIFNLNGYVLTLDQKKDINSANVYTFENGAKYNYKKLNKNVAIQSSDGYVNVDDSSIIHYTDDSIQVLKDVVGINLNNIDKNIIFYYNIFKNTMIKSDNQSLYIETADDKINFEKLLLRINENKYLLVGQNIRLSIGEQVIDFGNNAYIEYIDGKIVQIYNSNRYYKTITTDAKLVMDDITIDLNKQIVYKETKAYLTLSNLIINYDGNVDLIPKEKQDLSLPELKNADVELPISNIAHNNYYQNDNENEEVVDEEKKIVIPYYKVTEFKVTTMGIDAKVEIFDKDNLLNSDTIIRIVENASSKTVYESTSSLENTQIYISYAGLDANTEYTMYLESSYKIDDIEYNRCFVSKIFRTESVGIDLEKRFVDNYSISVDVDKEEFSKVSQLKVGIYNSKGDLLDTKNLNLSSVNKETVEFTGLTPNTDYMVKIYDVVIDGVMVNDGYNQKISIKTLKLAPEIGNLNFEINKLDSGFDLIVDKVTDENHGIVDYRYEIYDIRTDMEDSDPVLTITKDNLTNVFAKVDESTLFRGQGYTYQLVVNFYDNEKYIEYTKTLGSVMKLDGVNFPSIRFEENYVTWEQINGVIIVEDYSGAIIGNDYKIVYKNSLGAYTSLQITADSLTGNIPININNLRANETYTFDVYASVNLQDGNPTADETYIGSVYVQTKEPNPIRVTLTENKNMSKSFSLNFQLGNDSTDASLEASTLSELTFTLYQGSTTSGAEAMSIKTIDLEDSEDYISTLKDLYYDNHGEIDPDFFAAEPSDFTSRVYTLQISGAYDYTSYKNEIPLLGDTVFTFTTNNYVPGLPSNVDDAMYITPIYNKSANLYEGLKYDNTLDPNTVVAYKIMAQYTDTYHTAISGVYHVYVYNPNTGEYELLDMDREIALDEHGQFVETIYELKNGTKNSYDTDYLRRGNSYYFSYEVFIDTDEDFKYDVVYPKIIDENIVLRSRVISPQKQSSIFKMYPSSSTSNSSVWKYKYTDIDNALSSKNLDAYVGTKTTKSSSAEVYEKDSYQRLEFKNLVANDYYTIKKNELLNSLNEVNSTTLAQGWQYPVSNNLGLTYYLEADDNYISVIFDNYEAKKDMIDSITNVEINIKPTNKDKLDELGEYTISNARLEDGIYKINLFDISKYIGTEVEVIVNIIYDSGVAGFDVSNTYSIYQKVSIEGPSNYYVLNGANLTQGSLTTKVYYSTSFNDLEQKIQVKHIQSGKKYDYNVSILNGGVMFEDNYIIKKGFNYQEITSSNNKITFNKITPGISLRKTSSTYNITSYLTSASVIARLLNTSMNIKDDLYYIELFKTDNNGGNRVFERNLSYHASVFNDKLIIDDLLPGTNYLIKFFTYVYNSETGKYDKQYLYDIDSKTTGDSYRFHTLSEVKVSNVDLILKSESYDNKVLELDYNLSSITGYDGIKYEIFEFDGINYVPCSFSIPTSKSILPSMKVEVDATPGNGSNIKWGNQYLVKIIPYGEYTVNGETVVIDLPSTDVELSLARYTEPYIGTTVSKTSSKITFKISVNDPNHLIYNDEYTYYVKDSRGKIIIESQNIKTSVINNTIVLNKDAYNLMENEEYTIYIDAKYDYLNSQQDMYSYKKKKSIVFGDSVSVGTINAVSNIKDNGFSIDLFFLGSYKLGEITEVMFSIADANSAEYIFNRTERFNISYNPSTELYNYNIPVNQTYYEHFINGNMYLITINFYKDSELVSQEEIIYYHGVV